MIEPTSGSAEVLGFNTRTQGAEIRARSGALLEHSGLYERLSAEDNLRFYGRVARMPKPELDRRIQELLTHLGLWDRRKEAVVKWSRGMKQKLAIARPLLHRPSLVFLDEPTAGLDPRGRREFARRSRCPRFRARARPFFSPRTTWRRRKSCAAWSR